MTSLDGASFDVTVGTLLDSPGWGGVYGFRAENNGNPNAFGKMVDGFVRFQGFLMKKDPNDFERRHDHQQPRWAE